MSNREYNLAVLLGAVVGMTFLTLFYMTADSMLNTKDEEQLPKQPTPTVEVVDEYNGCDVLRYAPPQGAKYQYFLDCSKIKE